MTERAHRRADVVILIATQPKLNALLQVEAGAVAGSPWEEATEANGLPVFYRRFNGKGARPLRVAAAVARDMDELEPIAKLLRFSSAWSERA